MLGIPRKIQAGARAPSIWQRLWRSLAASGVAVCLVVAAIPALTADDTSGSGGSSRPAATSSDKNKPPQAAAVGETHLITLPNGKVIAVAVGITTAVIAGGVVLSIAADVPFAEAALAIGQMSVNLVKGTVKVLWRVGKAVIEYTLNARKLVRKGIKVGGKVLRGLEPLAIPLTLLAVLAYEHAKDREVILDAGLLDIQLEDSGDTCLIRFISKGADEVRSARVLMDDDACAQLHTQGAKEPGGYVKYGGSDDRRAVYDFFYPRQLRLNAVKQKKMEKVDGQPVQGRSCELIFAEKVKLKLSSQFLGGKGKNARVSDPCGAYVGREGEVVFAGDKVKGIKIWRSKRVPKGSLLHEATVRGYVTSQPAPGLACKLIVEPNVDRGIEGLRKDKQGRYVIGVEDRGSNVGLCVGQDGHTVRLRMRYSGLKVWMQLPGDPDERPPAENDYTLRHGWKLAA